MKKNKKMIVGISLLTLLTGCKGNDTRSQQLTCSSGDSKDKYIQVYHYMNDKLKDITLNLTSDYTEESEKVYRQTLTSLKSIAVKQDELDGVSESITAEDKNIQQTIKVSMSHYDLESDPLGLFQDQDKDNSVDYFSAKLEDAGFSCDITNTN